MLKTNDSTELKEMQSAADFIIADGTHREGGKWIIVIDGDQRAETTLGQTRAEEIYAQIMEYEEAIPVYADGRLATFIFRIESPAGFTAIGDGNGTGYICNHCLGKLAGKECQFCEAI